MKAQKMNVRKRNDERNFLHDQEVVQDLGIVMDVIEKILGKKKIQEIPGEMMIENANIEDVNP